MLQKVYRINSLLSISFFFQVSLIIPIMFIFIVSFLVLLPFYVDPIVIGMALLITALGVPVYLVGVVWTNKPRWLISIMGKPF